MNLRGKCHCGNIVFSLVRQPGAPELQARVCTCSFCVKHGGVWTSDPRGRLEIAIADPSLVSRYGFGTRTAEFQICTRCGVVPVVTSRIDGTLYAVVSVNALEGIDPSRVPRSPADFDGEGEDTRLARRKRNWIPDVRYGGAVA